MLTVEQFDEALGCELCLSQSFFIHLPLWREKSSVFHISTYLLELRIQPFSAAICLPEPQKASPSQLRWRHTPENVPLAFFLPPICCKWISLCLDDDAIGRIISPLLV
jgi:hypothetical protein